MPSPEKPPLIVLVGPTGVGKTELSLRLAERLDGEIVSADSRLFYRGMDIGTAKPTPAERARVPHHLIDITSPAEPWTLAVFQRAAYAAIAAIHLRGRLPFLVGGTGQYVSAVVEGWTIPPQEPDPRLRAALARWADDVGPEALHARLARVDPEAAARLDPRNIRRTVRALEVIFCTGRKFSAQRQRGPVPFTGLRIGLTRPRPELYARLDARIAEMLAAGFLGEVENLLRQGFDPALAALSAIGYQEMVEVALGHTSLEEAITLLRRRTRQFVRRQANWFKETDPSIRWFRVQPGVEGAVEAAIREFARNCSNE